MKDLIRSRPVLGMATLLLVASLAISFAATGIRSTHADSPPSFSGPVHPNPQGGLDCNGYSATGQKTFRNLQVCADLNGVTSDEGYTGKGEDNGHYVGRDEPSTQFNSNIPGSGNNMQYTLVLPRDHPLPTTQTFENLPAFWFSLAMCDPFSFPQGTCTPDSDTNNLFIAGSAFVELQFFPPGFAPFNTQISCDATHWCAALNIDSLECITDLGCNPSCTEPVNFSFLETNGVPPGPPGPAAQTSATFTPDANTLLMNQGDVLSVTLFDTANGLETFINDLTTHQSGFMVASADNGFTNTNPLTCAPTPFNFHPEYSTARFGNAVPWAALQANVGFAIEAGHFETGSGDGDTDDAPCFPTGPISILPGCIDQANGDGDLDFDGTSYQPDWPDGTHNNATSLLFTSPLSAANGSSSYHDTYPIMQIETDVPASESTCTSTGIGCTVPPPGASFYPFYNIARGGGGNFDSEALGGCFFLFGNKMQGVNDLRQDAQYGTPDLPWFFGTSSSGPQANPCLQ